MSNRNDAHTRSDDTDEAKERRQVAQGERAGGDRGNSFVEYALIVALIVMVCLSAMTMLGESTSTHLSNTATKVALAN